MSGLVSGDFLFPRFVMFQRIIDIAAETPSPGSGYGGLGDGGDINDSYQTLTNWMPASIQIAGSGGKPEIALPEGPEVRPFYRIEIPFGYIEAGDVIFRDRMTDDLTREFLVTNVQSGAMGWDIVAQQISV